MPNVVKIYLKYSKSSNHFPTWYFLFRSITTVHLLPPPFASRPAFSSPIPSFYGTLFLPDIQTDSIFHFPASRLHQSSRRLHLCRAPAFSPPLFFWSIWPFCLIITHGFCSFFGPTAVSPAVGRLNVPQAGNQVACRVLPVQRVRGARIWRLGFADWGRVPAWVGSFGNAYKER